MTTVGILGGGQLGRMLALAGAPLGVRCVALEPAPDAPVAVAADVLAAPFDDRAALEELARRCDVITIEVEHVPVESLSWLAERLPVHPSPEVVAMAQDRLAEKQLLTRLGIGTAPFAEPGRLLAGFPSGTILKRRTGGFDGRGQVRLDPSASPTEVMAAARELGRRERGRGRRGLLPRAVGGGGALDGRDGGLLPRGREPPPPRHPARDRGAGPGVRHGRRGRRRW